MISLRPIATADARAVASAVDQSRDALRRWMPCYRDDYDVDTAHDWIASVVASSAAGTGQQFVILDDTDNVVGVIGIEDINEESGRAMIGYWLATPMTGRQFGRHAVSLVLEWARRRPGLRVVWGVVAEANLASRRVLDINGFRRVGTRGVDERGDTALLYEIALHSTASR